MKVVHIIDSGGFYGAEVMLLHLCKAQMLLDIEVDVISIGTPGDYEKPLEKKLRDESIPVKPWRMMPLPDLRQSLKILNYCKDTSADIIHSHGYKGNILLGLTPKHLRKHPILTTVHGYTQKFGFNKLGVYQWLDKKCMRRLDAVVLVSEGMRHQVNEKSLHGKLHIIPNGIPSKAPSELEKPEHLLNDRDFKVAAIGRLSQEKNFQLVIRAMAIVLEEIPNAKLVIYGEGEERQNLEELISNLNLKEHVHLPGYIQEPSSVYRYADVLVNCSLTEGMPLSLLEAMRESCPIVATDIPASRALLDEVGSGAILSPLSPPGIAEAIISMHHKLDTKDILTEPLLKVFNEKYTSQIMAKNYANLYLALRKNRS